MAIARDVSSNQDLTVTTATGSHTCAASAFLVIGTFGSTGYATVCTYNGVSLTRVANIESAPGEYYLSLWYLTNPASGAHTINATVASGSVGYWAQSYTGAPGGFDNYATHIASSGGSNAVSVTTVADNCWTVGIFECSANTLAAGTGTNFLFTQLHNTCLGDSNGVIHPAASYTMNTTGGTGTHAGIVMSFSPSSSATVNTVVQAGGGGGGNGAAGGGGGGGYQAIPALNVSPQAYSIVVGAGGAGSTTTHGATGSNSSFSVLTANGGGYGGGNDSNPNDLGGNGGSGGGSGNGPSVDGAGGIGSQGGNGGASSQSFNSGGGGGGAGGNGADTASSAGGNGGNGIANSISGASVTYGDGGGGGSNGVSAGGTGGTGGGGNGGTSGSTHAVAGTANTGGGGGGDYNSGNQGATGGSGVVVIAFPTNGSTGVSTSSTGGTITTSGGNQIHTFNSNGTWTMVAYSPSTATASFLLKMI